MNASQPDFLRLLQEFFPEVEPEKLLQQNLLQLGADSIIAALLAARIWHFWDISLSVKCLLDLKCCVNILALLPTEPRQSPREKESVKEGEIFHQTDAQQMIYLELFRQPDTTAYNIPLIAVIPQAIAPQRFQQALQQAVERFPALFCCFYDENGQLLFRYTGTQTVPLQRYDNLQQASAIFVQPCQLNKDLLLRAAIVPWDGQQTLLMLDFCHIAADGLSVGFFLRQLRAALLSIPQTEETPSLFAWSCWTGHVPND